MYEIKCSTKSFALVPLEKIHIENLVNVFGKDGYKSGFRNAVSTKITGKCLKLFVNGMIQVNGVKSFEEFIEIIKNCNFTNDLTRKIKYSSNCVMSNWTINLKKTINLKLSLETLNKEGYIAYFQRGCSLIVKLKEHCEIKKWTVHKKVVNVKKETVESNLTLLIFRTGKCILVCGKTDECMVKKVEKIFSLINYN